VCGGCADHSPWPTIGFEEAEKQYRAPERGQRAPLIHAAYTAMHLYAGPGCSVWVSAGNARSTSEQHKFSLGTIEDRFFYTDCKTF